MLLLASLLLGSGAWLNQACPQSFTVANTTVSALSQSQELALCVSKAVLVTSSDGTLNLVINSNTAPTCLVYPNGLAMDLSFELLASGHVGCWSLYPPSQPVAIVNLSNTNSTKVNTEIRRFRPTVPLIFYSPKQDLLVGDYISFSSSAKTENLRCRMLNLECRVRFTPISQSWQFGSAISKSSTPKYLASTAGVLQVTLKTTYKIEYYFPGLTPWLRTYPNIVLSSFPVQLKIGSIDPPITKFPPRLVDGPCLSRLEWGC